jgi:trimeric autotransporter adhesin
MRTLILTIGLSLGLWLPQQGFAEPDDWCDAEHGSPLVVDITGDGLKLGQAGVGVHFDLYANGTPLHLQWVRKGGDEAFLVADWNGNGVVDDGSELFGEGTTLINEGGIAANGYIALAQYDSPSLGGNDDGVISNADAVWPMLRLWLDSNADGKSTRAELKTPKALGLVSFGTIPKSSPRVDEAGNLMPFYSWVARKQGKKTLMVDVFFVLLD